MSEEESVHREEAIHGERWRSLHDGYFSDPAVAQPFLIALEWAVNISHPSSIADLGGGTGFILCELLKILDLSGVRLINVDVSQRQLSQCSVQQIATIKAFASQITREDLVTDDGRLLLIARSLLHYLGRSGLTGLLEHIRRQMHVGEMFVHQSACFGHPEDAGCMNMIYSLMGSDKWYFTSSELQGILKAVGFEICSVLPAPKLHLTSEDLSLRYGLCADHVDIIRMTVERQFSNRSDVFMATNDGFESWLHYHIFICRAV